VDAAGNAAARKQLASWLISGNVTRVGEVVAHLVPTIFERWFGPKPLSVKFILTSFFTTAVFWILLLILRNEHPDVWRLGTYPSNHLYNTVVVLSMFIVDWVSLIKARLLVNKILRIYTLSAAIKFVCIDIVISYFLPLVILIILSFIPISPMYAASVSDKVEVYLVGFLTLTELRRLEHF
jgi:hypothetical protein